MSVNFPTHYIQQYSTNIELLLQQKGSKLRGLVSEGSYSGKQASPVDQIGAIAARRRSSRFEPMGRVDAPTDRRWIFPSFYDLPQLVDSIDKLQMVTDPESALVQNAIYAMGRAMDDEIIAAFWADAKTGENGGSTTSFGSGQSVSVSLGGTTSGLNVPKLREARRILMANEVDLDTVMPTIVITSNEHDDLLGEIQITNKDYNSSPVLVDGKLKSFMGFNFVHCERLTTGTDDASGTSTAVPVFVPGAMHLGIWQDLQTTISQRTDLAGLPWQAYVAQSYGATRIEEKKIVRIWCR